MLRSPLFPVNKYKAVLDTDIHTLLAQHPHFVYALYIASKDLVAEIDRWKVMPGEFNEKKIDKLRKSLYKYWVRASTRSTPYGVFAGCTTGTIGEQTSFQLAPIAASRQHVRIDMDYYTKICHHIQSIPAVNTQLQYFSNNSIYNVAGKYRYAEYIIVNHRRKYLLTSITETAFITNILQQADKGLTIDEMVDIIHAEDDTISVEEATAFIDELIKSQLLIASIEPTITGDDNVGRLIATIQNIQEVDAFRDTLLQLNALFAQQDFDVQRLQSIVKTCEEKFPLSLPKDLLQVDLFKSAVHCSISEQVMGDITTQIQQLMALCTPQKGGGPDLQTFRQKFTERYESQEVPLNILLDSELGIGYGAANEQAVHAPFVEDVVTDTPGNGNGQTINWNMVAQLCLQKYEAALRGNLQTVELTESELKQIGDGETIAFAPSCYLFGSMIADDPQQVDAGKYQFNLQAFGGPSAANLLGRFCSGDAQLGEIVKTILEKEAAEYPGCIIAEVVHFPEARAGNVLIRPVLREYEIPYVGMPGVDAAHQIPVSDLMVSVRNNEIILRSKRLNKRVIPRLSSAHNYSFNSLPIYKFLCDLQHQTTVGGLFWDWGIFSSREYLPRVVYKNIIVSRAYWYMKKELYTQIGKTFAEQKAFLQTYREKWNMPARVMMAQADNELLLDLENDIAIGLLFENLAKVDVQLKEYLFAGEVTVVRDEQQASYANELLIPLHFTPKEKPIITTISAVKKVTSHTITRSFSPGSEWLYVKIYGGYLVGEDVLANYLSTQLTEWKANDLLEEYFFIRYADPKPHIRLRIKNTAQPAYNQQLLQQLESDLQPYIQSGQIAAIQCDTYVRELERYGSATMEMSETLFYADSAAVLGIISLLDGAEGEMYRWKLAMRGVDMLLDDFNFSLQEKKELLAHLRTGFVEEFGGMKLLHKQLNDKYRSQQKEIYSFMNREADEENEIEEVIALYEERSVITRPLAMQIQKIVCEQLQHERAHWDIISSYIHMFLNRIFVAKQRKHELVLYHFLEKYYLSQLALVELAK
ncbi:lantibiotic dehydratase [Chitinophaga skermanii]|nr:lantibiotic dehydratase [Chitinophaga skermanii]